MCPETFIPLHSVPFKPCPLPHLPGIARVVVGVVDPNPLVGGAGVATLRSAGIEVDVGCEEEACFAMNREFMQRMAAKVAAASTAAAARR
jgi:hypothetical protein